MSGQVSTSIYEFGDFELDATQRLLRSKEGRPVPLTPRVFETLLYLVGHAGQLIEKSALMEAIWPRVVVEEGSLSQAIYELRRALGERPDEHRFIVTVPGRGYQFVADVVRRERASATMTRTQPPEVAPQPSMAAGPSAQDDSLPQRSTEDIPAANPLARPAWKVRQAISPAHILYFVTAFALAAGAMAVWHVVGTRAFDPSTGQPGVAQAAMATVAVLPFVDLSHQQDQQYLSEGLSEELIHALAQNSSLRVLARTSSFSFKGRDVDIATIAGKLGATHVIEGSVRKSSGRVRVAVHLIDGATSFRIWSQTYDRNLEDALAIQHEIASSIATALKLTLTGDQLAKAATTDPRAYEHFLLANFFFSRRQLGDVRQAEQAYRRAIELDPSFARAWAGLSGAYYISADRFDDLGLSRDEALERMRDAAERALALDPNLAVGHVRRAMHRFETGDRDGSREQARRAAALEPNNPLVLGWLANIALSEGRLDDAIDFLRRTTRNDPLTPAPRANLGTFLYFAGRFDEATTELRTALQLAGTPDGAWGNPNNPASDAALSLAKALTALRRFDEALALTQSWPEGQFRDNCLALVHYARGNRVEADAALRRLVASESTDPHWVAETYAHRGDIDEAFRWMTSAAERSRERHEAWQAWRMDIRYSPFVTSLHRDRRWKAWLAEKE